MLSSSLHSSHLALNCRLGWEWLLHNLRSFNVHVAPVASMHITQYGSKPRAGCIVCLICTPALTARTPDCIPTCISVCMHSNTVSTEPKFEKKKFFGLIEHRFFLKLLIEKTPQMNLFDELKIRSIKILDIGFVTILYLAIAALCVKLFDFEYDAKMDTAMTVFVLTLEIWLFGVLVYISRNIVQAIPFPLDGVAGYSHKMLKEIDSAWVFGFVFLALSHNMQDRMIHVWRGADAVARR